MSSDTALSILLTTSTFLSTLLGGWAALRARHRLHNLLGFIAGVLLGVVGFDLFPEIIEQARHGVIGARAVMVAFVGGFLAFHVFEKMLAIHHSHEDSYADHRHPNVGVFSALALIGHSLMDGVSIGLGFQVNTPVGVAVAIAVISHDFTDGMNTVTLMLLNGNPTRRAMAFLVLDALAPIAGLALSHFLVVPPVVLATYLGVFAGFLMYIGAADILPEAHSSESSALTIVLTVVGALASFAISVWV